MKIITRTYKNHIIFAFFVLLLVVGLAVYKDYGISWDEPLQRKYGQDVFDYVLGYDDKLLKSKEKYYGPVFEFFLLSGEQIFKFRELKSVYYFRHMSNYLYFVLGVYFLFKLATNLLGGWKWGILCSLTMVLTPRIFAHAFYNSKDIPFMVSFIIGFYFSHQLINKTNDKYSLLAALTTAICVDIRLMGGLLVILTLIGFAYNTDFKKIDKNLSKRLISYLLLLGGFTTLFWPTLWKEPLTNLKEAFKQMSKYPQSTSMLYYGEKIKSTNVPWHYIPGSILVSIPALNTILFIMGIFTFFMNFRRDKHLVLIFLWFFLPLILVILLKSNLYDSWRQIFFIYPALVIFMVLGFKRLLHFSKYTTSRALILIVLFIGFLNTAIFMVRWHPHQNVYFSFFVGDKSTIQQRFELDYWGLSYKQAYEFLEQNYDKTPINIAVLNYPGENNLHMAENPKKFLLTQNTSQADFYLTNYRGSADKTFGDWQEVYSIVVEGNKIMGIYQNPAALVN